LEIEGLGIPCWMAPRDVPFGANFGAAIIDAIEATEVFVVLLSASANGSIHVANEIERAVNYRKAIIPLRLEKVKPSRAIELHISARQWVDLFEGEEKREQNMRRFLDVLRDVLRSWLVPDLPPLNQDATQKLGFSGSSPEGSQSHVAHSAPSKRSAVSSEEMTAKLDKLLDETDYQNRSRVAHRVKQLVPDNLRGVAIEKLHKVLESDESSSRRYAAAAMLVKLGGADLSRLRSVLVNERESNVRSVLLEVAKDLAPDDREEYLFESVISDDSDYVRDAALIALIDVNRDRAIEAVREFLSENSRRPQFAYNSQKAIAPIVTEAEVPLVFELATRGLGDNYSNGLPAWNSLKRFSRESLIKALGNARVNPEHRAKLSAEIDKLP